MRIFSLVLTFNIIKFESIYKFSLIFTNKKFTHSSLIAKLLI